MQCVPELMEHRCHLVPCQQRRLSFRGFGTVAHIEDDGQLTILTALFGKTVHPGTASLGRSAEIVAAEKRFRLTVLVKHLKGFHVGMVEGDVSPLLEGESIYPVGGIEHSVDEHAVDIEIGLHLFIADIQLLLLHLGGIVEPVVGLQLEICALALACEFLDGLGLSVGFGLVLCDETFQEVIYFFWGLGHGVL